MSVFFFFNDTATTEIYTLSLHDALPISRLDAWSLSQLGWVTVVPLPNAGTYSFGPAPISDSAFYLPVAGSNPRGERSEEHTSELQSRLHLVCRLLLEKKHALGMSKVEVY